MKSKKMPVLLMAAVLSLMMAGCGEKKQEITFTAVIEEVQPQDSASGSESRAFLGTILVSTENTDVVSGDKAYVAIPDPTPILKPDGTKGSFSNLTVGAHLVITFDGTVRESDPVQLTASKIEIE